MITEGVHPSQTQITTGMAFEDSGSAPLWTLNDLLSVTNGKAINANEVNCYRVHTDSRSSKAGDLFIPIKGPRVDGHDYIIDAFEAGATLSLCQKDYFDAHKTALEKKPLICVDSIMDALDKLGRFARERSNAIVFGVTGSYGKTSFKDALAHCLNYHGATHKTERSFNNQWGLPLTLANLHLNHDFAVIEMGMNNPGEIESYTRISRPHIAIITNTGDAHIGKLGSLQAIADAKAEVFLGLEDHPKKDISKTAILWAENWATDSQKEALIKNGVAVKTFGESGDFKTTSEISENGTEICVSNTNTEDRVQVIVPIFSDKWALNAGAVAVCLSSAGLDWVKPLKSLEAIPIPQGRGNIKQTESGITIIDESYNAAPGSMSYALETLSSLKRLTGRRVIAVLGEMLELGDGSMQMHINLSKVNGFSDIDKVYVSGEMMGHLFNSLPKVQQGLSSDSPGDIAACVLKDYQPGDIILVKGSRGQWARQGRMSVVVETLLSEEKTVKGGV